MCGIAGIIGSEEDATLERGLESLHRRGPDGSSATRLDGLAFGSTRLAIMDLENGFQPFHDGSGRWVLHGTGEIYNAAELRDHLSSSGARFRSTCDLEAVVHAWSAWGEQCIGRLNGMFAIAIWDRWERVLHLFRDPCGQKPLYYHRGAARFAFASEIRALRAMGVPFEFDPSSLGAYLSLRYLPGPDTACRNVVELPAGHHLKIDARGVKMRRVMSEPDAGRACEADLLDSVRTDAVRIASRADVPAVLYLSGGVDSWMLAEANRSHGRALDAITLDFPGSLGEGDAAAEISRQNGLRHHRIPWRHDAVERLPDLVERLESPVGDPLIVAFDLLAESARGIGAKVALSGEGPDEWFGGYSFHRAAGWADCLHRVGGAAALNASAAGLSLGGPLADRVAGLGQSLGADGRRRVASWLRHWCRATREERANGLRRLFTLEEIRRMTIHSTPTAPDLAELEPFGASSPDESLVCCALASQTRGWLPGWVIGRHEKIALARGLEIRMPFLDPRIAALSCPDAKKAWRRCAKRAGMPSSGRPKQAFSLPAVEVVRSPVFLEIASGYLNPEAIVRRGWFDAAAVERIKTRALDGSFLAAKQWAALVILEIWAVGQKMH